MPALLDDYCVAQLLLLYSSPDLEQVTLWSKIGPARESCVGIHTLAVHHIRAVTAPDEGVTW